MLHVQDIHKSFGALEVLKGVSLSAQKGDVITLIGGSGSGKSTFLRCMNLLEVPDRGSVEIDGLHVETTSKRGKTGGVSDLRTLRELRKQFGMVFQNFNLLPHMTAIGNVMDPLRAVHGVPKAEAYERALEAISQVGIEERKDYFPSQLSGGQQQRVAIARALAVDPEILLFDEPTSALDPELVSEVLRVIRKLADSGRTMVLVTHEMAFARDVSSEICFLRGGYIEHRGSPDEVFSKAAPEACQKFLHGMIT